MEEVKKGRKVEKKTRKVEKKTPIIRCSDCNIETGVSLLSGGHNFCLKCLARRANERQTKI